MTLASYPGPKFCTEDIPHSAIIRIFRTLNGGVTYHFYTTNTTGWWWPSPHPDPVMHIVNVKDSVIAASNDDFIGLDPHIVFRPQETALFVLIIHSYSTATAGWTDVMLSINSGTPVALATRAKFGGTKVLTDWNAGITFETAGGWGDKYLILRAGNRMFFNDDGAGFPNSRITPPFSLHGGSTASGAAAYVGSFSEFTEGRTALCQYYRSWMQPLLSPPGMGPTPTPFPTSREMAGFVQEYEQLKPALQGLDADERDAQILELQRRLLPESQIRQFASTPSLATAGFVEAQERFLAQYRETEPQLDAMEADARSDVLERMKIDIVERAEMEPS
jgi:hypothetical protein